jgi:ABC-type bacteriocin/lantibiotic exporter with double-glycine peptidase domain
MYFLTKNLLPRVVRLVGFFRRLIGLRRMIGMMTSSLALSVLELAGFALLFPFIKLVTDPRFSADVGGKFSTTLLRDLLLTHHSTVLVAGLLLIAYFIVKAFIYSWLVRYQADVAAGVNAKATRQLIDVALRARYQLFVDVGAVKIAGVGYSNTAHASLLFQCTIAALNEAIFLVFVLLSLSFVAPWVMFALIAIGLVLAVCVFAPVARRVAKLGHATRDLDMKRHRFVFSMANAVRDIKIMGLEATFSRQNADIVNRHVRLFAQYQTISSALRVLVEALMMCSVVIAGIWFTFFAGNLAEVAPLLATIGLVAVRLAPALSRLSGNYNSFRFSLPIVEALLDMIDTIERYPQLRTSEAVSLAGGYRAESLSFSYQDRKVLVDISIEIPEGHIVAIVGPSGSGKSTLLDLLAGLQKPSSGRFLLGGKPFDPFLSASFSQRIGYVPQSIALLDATLLFNITLEENPDLDRLQSAVKKANLQSLLSSLPEGLDTLVGEGGVGMSGGQRQRVGIARALYRNPELLILDEVTSALDDATAQDVIHEIQALRGQTSILIVTHDINIVEADRVYQLIDGRIVTSTLDKTQ